METKSTNYVKRGWIGIILGVAFIILIIIVGQVIPASEELRYFSLSLVIASILSFAISSILFFKAKESRYVVFGIIDLIISVFLTWFALLLKSY